MTLQGQFDCVWRYLSQQGKCDAIGSAEYRRVLEEWCSFQRTFLVHFIHTAANRPPLEQAIARMTDDASEAGIDLEEIGRLIGELGKYPPKGG